MKNTITHAVDFELTRTVSDDFIMTFFDSEGKQVQISIDQNLLDDISLQIFGSDDLEPNDPEW